MAARKDAGSSQPAAPALAEPLRKSEGGVALALGGGGARGMAHIVALEALDELGVKPAAIAGCSIGAIIGAAYCAGLPGRSLRAYALATFRERARVIARLLEARVGRITQLIQRSGIGNPVLVDGERLLDLFWPDAVPDRFESLTIPFLAIATDYHLRCEVTLSAGALTPAVGASMAIPGLVRPVQIEGRVLIDGGAVNPLPYEHLMQPGMTVIAIDVGGAAFVSDQRVPEPIEAMLGASQILMSALVQRMLERRRPDAVLRPDVGRFAGLDFFKTSEILACAQPMKDEIKRALEPVLSRPR